jgi:hypothetical protein
MPSVHLRSIASPPRAADDVADEVDGAADALFDLAQGKAPAKTKTDKTKIEEAEDHRRPYRADMELPTAALLCVLQRRRQAKSAPQSVSVFGSTSSKGRFIRPSNLAFIVAGSP